MVYSKHFADGYGIVYNIGGYPVDGATDFLFMVVLALLYKTGLSLMSSAIAIGVFSQIVTS